MSIVWPTARRPSGHAVVSVIVPFVDTAMAEKWRVLVVGFPTGKMPVAPVVPLSTGGTPVVPTLPRFCASIVAEPAKNAKSACVSIFS